MIANWLRTFRERYCVLTDWNIGVVEVSSADIARLVADGRLGRVRWCPRLWRLRSLADPFIWPLPEGARVLYEEIDHWERRGHIRSLSLERLSRLQSSRVEIVRPHHLSYPFVLEWEGVWYCIPETAQGDGAELHAWDAASRSWKLEHRLMDDVGILDATVFRHDGLWYLFCTKRGDGAYDKLRIWWSESLKGEWRPHPMNPAKTDIRSARPAGPIFQSDGHWYRPAQDCMAGYGSALTINRIDVLTPTEFRETTVSRVVPDPDGPYPDGLHTLAIYGDKLLIDGKRIGLSPLLPFMKAARRISQLARGRSASLAAPTREGA